MDRQRQILEDLQRRLRESVQEQYPQFPEGADPDPLIGSPREPGQAPFGRFGSGRPAPEEVRPEVVLNVPPARREERAQPAVARNTPARHELAAPLSQRALLQRSLASRGALKRAMLLREVLGPPKALQDPDER